ncbi:unspecified product [Leptomonas pyrrhocoris]|uniref:Unspecified product n=1 Tax=Leptomonas pyrrhocoris TaxID=157538 RepID=A0A0N0VHJ7_LEPPY|nr:unspecified product [Leptomonas pyrrhocoris]KPA85238.1 unspecified product [Leptomonas pyrrhocoris]|eukprot:XP_015663677.1 unspecified product [Leptomonas pyrrhocoris]
MSHAASLLSSPHSPYERAPSPFSFVQTVETSPVEEARAPSTFLSAPPPEPPFSARGGAAEVDPLDVRLIPVAFTATYWCGLAVLYAFGGYVIAMSPTWRGPVIIWAALILFVVFSLWRHLPAEKQRVQKLADEIVSQRCGGYYALAEKRALPAETEMTELSTLRHPRPRSAPTPVYAAVA